MSTDKPLTENIAIALWVVTVVLMTFILLLLHNEARNRFDALDMACGVEQVEG